MMYRRPRLVCKPRFNSSLTLIEATRWAQEYNAGRAWNSTETYIIRESEPAREPGIVARYHVDLIDSVDGYIYTL